MLYLHAERRIDTVPNSWLPSLWDSHIVIYNEKLHLTVYCVTKVLNVCMIRVMPQKIICIIVVLAIVSFCVNLYASVQYTTSPIAALQTHWYITAMF